MENTGGKKKIGILVPTLRFGGGERVAANLINGLSAYSELDVHVILYDCQIDYEIADNVTVLVLHEKTDIKSGLIKAASFLKKIYKIKNILARNRITAIISIMPSMNIVSLLAAKGQKVIVTEHNVIRSHGSTVAFITNLLKRMTYRSADKVICVSKGVSKSLVKLVPNLDVEVIYNPLDLKTIKRLSKEKVNFKYESYIVGVGRLHKQKGFDILIAAFSKLKNDDVHLVILGDGDEKRSLEELARELGVNGRVHILGFQDNPYKYMREAAAFVLSSRWEGFGMVLAEALAVTSRVISFNCKSGPSEILNDGKLGLLVEAENTDDLVVAMEEMIDGNISFSRTDIDDRLNEFDINYVVDKYKRLL